MASTYLRLVEGGTRFVLAPDNALAAAAALRAEQAVIDAEAAGAAQVALAVIEADRAETAADAAVAAQEIVGEAGGIIAARDAASLYRLNAETAQAAAASSATAAATSATAASGSATAAATSAASAAASAANLVPYSPIATTQLYDAGGSVVVNGTGASLTNSDSNIAIAPKVSGGSGSEALTGASDNTRKAVAIGPYAGQNANGYDCVMIGWRAMRYMNGDNTVSVGIHSLEATNYTGRDIHGYGTRASGSITFTGLPSGGDTITINGATYTAGTDFTIAGTVSATIDNLLAKLFSVTGAALKGIVFRKSSDATKLEILARSNGTWANAVTLAVSGAGLVRSGATLSGGTIKVSTGNRDNYNGAIAIGLSAQKRWDMAWDREARGRIVFSGIPSVGATLTLGIPDTISTAAATSKRFTWVASGGSGLTINQGTDKASSIANALAALQAYQAANPTHTALSTVDFYGSVDGIEIVYKTTGAAANLYKTQVSGTNLSAPSPFLHGGVTFTNKATIVIGANVEAGIGAANVVIGNSAFRTGQGNFNQVIGSSSGGLAIGNNNVYWNGSGANLIGSNNFLLGSALGGGSTQSYAFVTSVSSTGLITMASPHSDAQLQVGRKFNFRQRNTTSGTDLIKEDGTNIATLTAIVVSPTELQIIDYTDSTGPAGTAVYSVTGTASNIELAPVYSVFDYATSWGDAPESFNFHIGSVKHLKAEVRAQKLQLGASTLQMTPFTNAAVAASGSILFASGSGNFAADETVTLNGTVFTAKAAATFATPNSSMIRWFRIGADMHESLTNLIACIRNSDDQSAAAKAVNRASFRIEATTGSGWRLGVRVDADTGSTAYTLATSKSGATVTSPTGATPGSLPVAASVTPPADGDMRVVSTWPRANGGAALMIYRSADDAWHFVGGAN